MERMSICFGVALALALGVGCSHGAATGDVVHTVDPISITSEPADDRAMTLRIDAAARDLPADASVPRVALFDLAYPLNAEEYEKLDGYGVLLVTTLSHDAAELPLRRVYFRTPARDLPLTVLATRVSKVPDSSTQVIEAFGRNRADSIFLFPLHLRAGSGDLLADFSRNRNEFVLARFPLEGDPSLENLPIAAPASPAPPAPALTEFIDREIPLFRGSTQR